VAQSAAVGAEALDEETRVLYCDLHEAALCAAARKALAMLSDADQLFAK